MEEHERTELFWPFYVEQGYAHIGKCVKIDREIADLLFRIWNRGILTSYSCQGSKRETSGVPGCDTYIIFPDMGEAIKFLRYNRQHGHYKCSVHPYGDSSRVVLYWKETNA